MIAAPTPTSRYDREMDVALRKTSPEAPSPGADAGRRAAIKEEARRNPATDSHQGELGTSTGVNISPGSDDDGWIVPPPVRLSDGSMVQLFKDGEALHSGYEAIKAAKRRVCLESYIFADDDTGRAFAELLAAKAREGLEVYCIYDSLGSMSSDRKMFRMMAHAGVRVREFHPIRPWECKYSWRPANRDHRKIMVVDDELAGLGGLNIGAEYAGSWVITSKNSSSEFWRDNAVSIRGPSAKHVLRAFARTWNYIGRGGRIRTCELYHNLKPTEGDFGLLASVPTPRSPLRNFLCDLMGAARRSIYITMAYFAPDDEFIDELVKAAKRGVRVRLMLPGRSDVHLLTLAARSFYEKLMSAGVEVYERQAVVLHSKCMVVDGHTSVIGSTNIDYRSIEYNLESSVIIRNDAFGQQMNDLFENDVRYSKKINAKEWHRRPTWDRFVQWSVSRARYLL
jgi:cardiolipin synthase A/B